MFDRLEYKRIAKRQLKGRLKTPILATLCTVAIFLVLSTPQILEAIQNADESSSDGSFRFGTGFFFYTGSIVGSVETISQLIMLAITGAIVLAYTNLFIEMWKTRDPVPFSVFLAGFSHWFKGMLAVLWLYLWVFLWSLLFFIPGIVKAYAYSQMFFIIADNPRIGVRKAMKLSIEMTRGYKGDLFVMDLSFIGWAILSSLTCGILNLYVIPYMQMSRTNAYKMLKVMAIQSGRVTAADFGDQDPQESQYDVQQQEPFGGQPSEPPVQGGAWDTTEAEDVEAYEADDADPADAIQLPPIGDDDPSEGGTTI